jgi:hypothetical protein
VRTYAICDRSKWVAWIFGSTLVALGGGALGFLSKEALLFERCAYISLPDFSIFLNGLRTDGPTPSPSAFPGCFLLSVNRQIWIGILVSTIFETG